MTLLAPIEPAVHSNPRSVLAHCSSLCWLFTPFLCNSLFLPTRRTSRLSLPGCVYPLLIQSTHSAPAELQTNTALSTGATLRSALPFYEALNILIFRPLLFHRWHVLPQLLASQGDWGGLSESPLYWPWVGSKCTAAWQKASPTPTHAPRVSPLHLNIEKWPAEANSHISLNRWNTSLLITREKKNNKHYLPVYEKIAIFPFFCWTCCATSAVIYEVL